MKKILFTLALFAISVLLFENNATAQAANSSALLRHIVIITFKKDASPDSIQALDNVYKDLSKSPLVKYFETGVNISTRDSGVIKHVYMTSFASKDDMDNYRKIPEYSKLFKLSLPVADEVTVADYWANK
jgi:Stress responsive A/B Barrel Domain